MTKVVLRWWTSEEPRGAPSSPPALTPSPVEDRRGGITGDGPLFLVDVSLSSRWRRRAALGSAHLFPAPGPPCRHTAAIVRPSARRDSAAVPREGERAAQLDQVPAPWRYRPSDARARGSTGTQPSIARC